MSEEKLPCCDEDVIVPKLSNFITEIIDEDLRSGRVSEVVTRFPPEPNGWLHLGHAKSICLNFGLAVQYGGRCNLRFDDTNPSAEEEEYIEGIKKDISWLGFRYRVYYASDYFDQLYCWAEDLILKNLAYVDEQSEEEVRKNRGSLTEPGVDSVYRNRSVEENLKRFREMRDGLIPEGGAVLRAKIDMANGNMNLRDPLLYRIKLNAHHPRLGTKWKIYPIYDFAHGQSDSIEKISHSICTLEFYDHRILYEWFQEKLGIFKTQQIEFARFNLSHTVMSKRRLLTLVREKFVHGWDDPRMPTLAGCRRKGYPAAAIREFAYSLGVAKRDNVIPIQKLENIVRQHLKDKQRRMAVIDPLRVVIENWEGEEKEEVVLRNHPELVEMGERKVSLGKVIFVDRSDFALTPPNANWHRLTVGGEVKLRGTYWLKCESALLDEGTGHVKELRCTIDHSTKGGRKPQVPRQCKGVLHWVSEQDSVLCETRIYDRLFLTADPDQPNPNAKPDQPLWIANLNPNSLNVFTESRVEKSVLNDPPLSAYQFERTGYFVMDQDSSPQRLVFNLTVSLQDTFAAENVSDSKEAQAKLEAKLAREKAAEERRLKKLAKEERLAAKAAKKLADGTSAPAPEGTNASEAAPAVGGKMTDGQ